ncbi:MAG: ribosome biogenesis GTPase YlqF [bacterium]|nr:ribosome biogenesis GTPase YlqF [bacterium]
MVEEKLNQTNINWFPGHMAKTLKEIEANIKIADLVLYCLDARAPLSCLNPEIDKIISSKSVVYVLNKSDLASEVKTAQHAKKLEEKAPVILTNANAVSNKAIIIKAIKKSLENKLKKRAEKNINSALKVLVIGVPNVGKSTIINLLAGSKKAVTGDKAGVTKAISWVKIADGIILMDSPGTLWSNLENDNIANNLAFIGSIGDSAIDFSELGFSLVKHLIEIEPQKIIDRYSLNYSASEINKVDPIEVYDQICLNRKFILKKNEIDYERAGKAIIDDFRSGRIGRITLE